MGGALSPGCCKLALRPVLRFSSAPSCSASACRNRGRPYQVVSFCDPAADRMIDSLNVIPDRSVAAPLWREYQHTMVQAAPYTVLYYPRRLTGVSRRLHGVEMDVRSEFNTVGRWWIAPADRGAAAPPPPTDTSRKR